ncbi:hypothetical protein EIP86_004335 [Pleurotus ostreatoroseus]|nr:hypothetical protein EIP86_004335 [Pleurotus ostreatoroseus]
MAEWRERPYIWHEWGENQKRLKIKAELEKVRQQDEALIQLKQQRVDNIIERTKVLGWTDIFNKMSHTQAAYFHAEPAMRIAKHLGDNEWKNVRPKVVYRMKQIERAQEWSIYMRRLKDLDEMMLPMRHFHPRCPTVVEASRAIPEVRELITSRLDKCFSPDDYDALKPLLSAYINSRHEQLTTLLSNLVRKTLRIEDEDIEDPLSLAAAFFRCERCTGMTAEDDEDNYSNVWSTFQGHFSECIAHVGHLVDWRDDATREHEHYVCRLEERNNGVDMYEQALSRCLATHTSDHCDMDSAFTAWGIRWASNVIRICGQDPRTVSPAEMDALDISLACDSCWGNFAIPVMTWRGALDHWKDCRRPAGKLKLRVASEHEKAAARPLIQKALANDLHYKDTSDLWGCSRCLKWGPSAYERTKSHVIQE